MKKTKRFLSVLRIAAEIVAVLLIIVCVSAVCMNATGVVSVIIKLWPYGVFVIAAYMLLSFGEDYVNNRILRPRC